MKKLLLLPLTLLSLSTFAASYKAENCEIFIDKVLVTFSSHGSKSLHIWLKTLNPRLDGSISKVGVWMHTRQGSSYSNEYTSDYSYEYPANSFFGAPDYFEGFGGYGNNDLARNWAEMSPFVETNKGTRYYANTRDGGNFVVDSNMISKVIEAQGQSPYPYSVSLERAVSTQDRLPELNPYNCR